MNIHYKNQIFVLKTTQEIPNLKIKLQKLKKNWIMVYQQSQQF